MKKTLIAVIMLIVTTRAYAQSGDAVEIIKNYIPLCILESYCDTKGLTTIKNCIVTDEKVSNIRYFSDDATTISGDSTLLFNYAKNVVALECGLGTKRLGVFRVVFHNEKDATDFGEVYAHLMGFAGKDKNDETTRYYAEGAPMNAVLINRKPSFQSDGQPFYLVICFVFQMGFCR